MSVAESKKLLMNKLLVSAILIALQILLVSLAYFYLKSSFILKIMFRVIGVAVVIFLVAKEEASSYKIIWIVLIFFFPFVGGILYIFLGNKKPAKKLRQAFDRQMQQIRNNRIENDLIGRIDDENIQGQLTYLKNQGFSPFYGQNVTYFSSGEEAFAPLLKVLKNARKYIFMEFFIVEEGYMFHMILDILKQKASEGVEVRFMYDDVGSLTKLPRKYYLELEKYGIKSIAFNPFVPVISLAMNNRDHKKIVVIDGVVGFSGGFNLADEYINKVERFGYWKDSGIMLEGQAVWSLTMMFLSSWNATRNTQEDYSQYLPQYHGLDQRDGYVVAYTDSPLDSEQVGEIVYLNMINQAHHYVYITTPYLILDDLLQNALINAATRGVDVRIVTPAIPDKKIVFKVTRSYYRELIEHGIHIYEYTPGFVHAKNFLVDDCCATVGTINLDYRSLYLHFENGVYLYNCSCLKDMKKDFMDVFQKSHEMTEEEVVSKKFKGFFEVLLRVIAPLL